MAKTTSELLRSEYWVSVWLGAVLIILVLVGVRPEAAGLSCSDGLDGLFGAGSLATTFGVGAALGVLCLIGVRLMEGAVRGFAVAFGAVFVLAWTARAIACNSTLSKRGVSYAITALALGLFVSNVL